MFDNQGEAGFPSARLKVFPGSRALEIDPVKQQIVWEYTGSDSDAPEWTFYSSFISDARRLPNGNTLINEGMNGRFFQISPAGEIVWEYVSPYFGPQPFGPAGKKVQSNVVYRAQPVPYDWTPPGTPHGERAVAPRTLRRSGSSPSVDPGPPKLTHSDRSVTRIFGGRHTFRESPSHWPVCTSPITPADRGFSPPYKISYRGVKLPRVSAAFGAL
jgi:hypothetical protein